MFESGHFFNLLMAFVLQKVLVRDLFCGEISNNVVSLVRVFQFYFY